MTVETQSRVQLAAAHWKPRFVANGIDVNDFERVLATATDWRDWAPSWQRVGDEHLSLAESAERKGRLVSATEAYQRAAWCYHLGKFLWFEDRALHDLLRERTVATYAKALAGLDPPGLRIEAPFEGASIPGILRIPADVARPPLVILVPGLDSVKEELYAIENEFLRRGMATLAIDRPGQGENAPHFPIRADSRAAAKEKRLRAIVALAGPYDLAECWAGLNALTKGGYVFYTKSRDEAEAFERAKALTLRGVLGEVRCPLLVIHGGKDRLFPPEQAERIVSEAPNATLLLYPEGNHVCNNIPYKYRPAMADWMSERLGATD